MKWLSALMGLLFLAAAAVQYNDPDPLRWMFVYSAAATVSIAAAAGRCPLWFAAVGFALLLVPAVWSLPALRNARAASFTQMSMSTVADEEVREALGLLLGASWLGIVFSWLRRSGTEERT